jgi:hypothetical protein
MQQKRLGHFVGSIGDKIYAIAGHYPNLNMVTKTEEYDTGLTAVPSPDFNGDLIVDFKDFSKLAQYWFHAESSVDIAPPPFGDRMIDFQDLAVFAEYWLQEVPDPNLIAHWKLDETEGSIAEDRAGDNNGTLHGQPQWQPAGGKKGGALQLDGINDYMNTDFVLNPAGGPFSVFAWVKGGAPGQVVISQTDVAGSGEIWLGADPLQGKLMTGLVPPPAGRTATPALKSDFIITDAQWHHIGFVWDGSRRYLYADGVEVAKDAGALAPLKSATGGLNIGASKTLEAAAFFSGLVDDVRIYNQALSAAEVAELTH